MFGGDDPLAPGEADEEKEFIRFVKEHTAAKLSRAAAGGSPARPSLPTKPQDAAGRGGGAGTAGGDGRPPPTAIRRFRVGANNAYVRMTSVTTFALVAMWMLLKMNAGELAASLLASVDAPTP